MLPDYIFSFNFYCYYSFSFRGNVGFNNFRGAVKPDGVHAVDDIIFNISQRFLSLWCFTFRIKHFSNLRVPNKYNFHFKIFFFFFA